MVEEAEEADLIRAVQRMHQMRESGVSDEDRDRLWKEAKEALTAGNDVLYSKYGARFVADGGGEVVLLPALRAAKIDREQMRQEAAVLFKEDTLQAALDLRRRVQKRRKLVQGDTGGHQNTDGAHYVALIALQQFLAPLHHKLNKKIASNDREWSESDEAHWQACVTLLGTLCDKEKLEKKETLFEGGRLKKRLKFAAFLEKESVTLGVSEGQISGLRSMLPQGLVPFGAQFSDEAFVFPSVAEIAVGRSEPLGAAKVAAFGLALNPLVAVNGFKTLVLTWAQIRTMRKRIVGEDAPAPSFDDHITNWTAAVRTLVFAIENNKFTGEEKKTVFMALVPMFPFAIGQRFVMGTGFVPLPALHENVPSRTKEKEAFAVLVSRIHGQYKAYNETPLKDDDGEATEADKAATPIAASVKKHPRRQLAAPRPPADTAKKAEPKRGMFASFKHKFSSPRKKTKEAGRATGASGASKFAVAQMYHEDAEKLKGATKERERKKHLEYRQKTLNWLRDAAALGHGRAEIMLRTTYKGGVDGFRDKDTKEVVVAKSNPMMNAPGPASSVSSASSTDDSGDEDSHEARRMKAARTAAQSTAKTRGRSRVMAGGGRRTRVV